MKQAGFSLLELCIVIALVALLATIGLITFPSYDRLFVHTELDRLYTVFLACAHKAIATNTVQTILFDIKNNSYILDNISHPLTQHVCFGFIPKSSGPPAHPVQPIEDAVTFVHQQALFYPDGKIQAGTIYLTDTDKQNMFALTSAVGQVSYVRRYRYTANAWELII